MVYNLPVHFAGGAFFVGWHGRKFGANDVDDYFAIMDSLRPLFAPPDFNTSTIGFYLNWIGSPDDIAVRLNYFSLNVPETIQVAEEFANDSGTLAIHKGEHVNSDKPIADYDDGSPPAELAFKNFLDANTRICLEMLQDFGRDHTRNMVQDYILNDLLQERRPEPVMDGYFARYSGTYRDVAQHGLVRRYWDDMFRWHRDDSVGLHFMDNMLVLREFQWHRPEFRALFQRLLNAP